MAFPRNDWFGENLLKEISSSIGADLTLEAFLQELQLHSKESQAAQGGVTLMTIHGAEGMQFEHVYLIGLVEDELPSFQSKKKGDNSPELEEERRNCFVAITRTMKTLTLVMHQNIEDGPKNLRDSLWRWSCSRKPEMIETI